MIIAEVKKRASPYSDEERGGAVEVTPLFMNSEFQSFYGLADGFDESTLRQRLDEPLYKEFNFS